MISAMPGMGGIEALRRIRAHHPAARVLTLSAHDDVMHARRALTEGALGFLSKRSAPEAAGGGGHRRWATAGATSTPALAQKLALANSRRIQVAGRAALRTRVRSVRAPGARRLGAAHPQDLSFGLDGRHPPLHIKQKLDVDNQSELTLINAIRHGLIEA